MELEHEKQEEGISLADFFRLLRLNWILIFVITIFATVVSGVFSYTMVQDKYKSSSEMLVLMYSQGSTGDPDNPQYDPLMSQRYIETTVLLIQSDYIINKLRDANTVDIPDDMSNTAIKNQISVTSSNTSFIIRISYTHPDKEFAQNMTNELTAISSATLMNDFHGNFLKLTDASEPESDTPSKVLYTLIGTLLGVVLSVGFVLIKQLLSNTYRTKEQLEAGTGLQVLGVIPKFQMKETTRK